MTTRLALAVPALLLLSLSSTAAAQSFTTTAGQQVHCSGSVIKDAQGALASCVLARDAMGYQTFSPGQQRTAMHCREGLLAAFTPQGWLSSCTISPHALTAVAVAPGPGLPEIGCRTNAWVSFNAAGWLSTCVLDAERTVYCGPGLPEARFKAGDGVSFNAAGFATSCPSPAPGGALAVSLTSDASAIDAGSKVLTSAVASHGKPPYRYEWYLGKHLSHSTTPNVVWASLGAGEHEVRVIVTDADGARGEASTSIQVRAAGSSGGGAAAGGASHLGGEDQRNLFECVCRCGPGVVGAHYHPEVLRDSPSCENLANGPCIGGTMGCQRWKMPVDGKCVAGCFEAAKVAFDGDAARLLQAQNGAASKPGAAAAAAPPAGTPASGAGGHGAIVNLALHKPARQSSVYRGTGIDQGPQFGVDGIRESSPRDPYLLVITDADNPPWWQVDLEAVHVLTKVVVYNRKNSIERLRTVRVMLSNDGERWETAYQHQGAAPEVLTVDLHERSARYVRLQLAEQVQLHFHECEVYGYAN